MYSSSLLTLETEVLDVLLVALLYKQVRSRAPRDGAHVARAVAGVVGRGPTRLAGLEAPGTQRQRSASAPAAAAAA